MRPVSSQRRSMVAQAGHARRVGHAARSLPRPSLWPSSPAQAHCDSSCPSHIRAHGARTHSRVGCDRVTLGHWMRPDHCGPRVPIGASRLESGMNAENPMAMRPRLHQGTLTVEAPRLSLRMASAIAAAARAAVSGPMRAAAPHAGGGALAALEALLAPMRTSSLDTPSPGASATTHSGTAGTGPSSLNAAAVAASLRNAATFPEADTTAFSQGRRSPGTGMTAAGGGGGGSAGSAGSTGSSTRPIASVADASPAEASALIAELGARVVHPQVIYAQRLRAHTRAAHCTRTRLFCVSAGECFS